MDELEAGLGVVVKATDQTRVEDVLDTHVVEQSGDGLEVLPAVVAEVVRHQRGVHQHLLDLRTLVVEDAQRVDLRAFPGLLVEREGEEEVLQGLPVGRTAVVVAEAGQLQAVAGEPQGTEAPVGQADDLRVQRGIVDADGLHTDLLELAVPAGLRTLVAEERTRIGQLHRKLTAVEVVLDDRAHHAGGAFGTQGHGAAAAVLEGVHLLGDDVGGFADTTGEQGGLLEDRQFDVAVTRVVDHRLEGAAHRMEVDGCRRHVVGHALRGGKRLDLRTLLGVTHGVTLYLGGNRCSAAPWRWWSPGRDPGRRCRCR